MTPAADLDVQVIRRTEVGGDRVVITTRRLRLDLVRPYATFMTSASTRYATKLLDFVTEAAAENYHEALVEKMKETKR